MATRATRPKHARKWTAAYSASQPLFDSLRSGVERINEQSSNLSTARDTVQNLHVYIVDESAAGAIANHERYMDCAVKAWQCATEVYADMFQALAKVTAAEPAEGREARNAHAAFAEMARIAGEAQKAAAAFVLSGDASKARAETGPRSVGEEQEEDAEDDEHTEYDSGNDGEALHSSGSRQNGHTQKDPHAATGKQSTNAVSSNLLGKRPLPEDPANAQSEAPPQKATRYSDNIRHDEKGHKILWENGASQPNVPFGTLGGSEKKARKAEKERQKRKQDRERKIEKRTAKFSKINKAKPMSGRASGEHVDTTRPIHERDDIGFNGEKKSTEAERKSKRVRPTVEYENVSAEVEARLMAVRKKEAEAKKPKRDKKRKRESGTSVDAGASGGRAKGPKRKRSKRGSHGPTGANAIEVKKRDREQGDVNDSAVKKKRRQSEE